MKTLHYLSALKKLLPSGWRVEQDTLLERLLYAFSEEFARFDENIESTLGDLDTSPDPTIVIRWERLLGFLPAEEESFSKRATRISHHLKKGGVFSKERLQTEAKLLGYEVEVRDNQVFTGKAGMPIYSPKLQFTFRVKVLHCPNQQPCNHERLSFMIDELKLAHTAYKIE